MVMMTTTMTMMVMMMMMITINQKILKYILYIQSKDEKSFVKQAFLISFDLHCNGKNSFHSHLMNMSEYFKLPDFNPDLLDIATEKSCIQGGSIPRFLPLYTSFYKEKVLLSGGASPYRSL